MSNLIPTPIVDKNGVTSIRHMKPVSGKSTKGRAIPSVAQPVAAPAAEALSNEHLIELIYPSRNDWPADGATIARELDAIREVSPEGLLLAERLMLTGTPTGVSLIRKKLDSTITSITFARKSYSDRSSWDKTLKSTATLDQAEVRRVWNCGNVMDEGFTEDTGIPGRFRNVIDQEFRREMPKLDFETADDRFWRGAAAFTIVDIYFSPKESLSGKEKRAARSAFYRETKKFIDYAGKHEDIGLVIRTAKERGTFVVSELKDIMKQGVAAPSIRDGAL